MPTLTELKVRLSWDSGAVRAGLQQTRTDLKKFSADSGADAVAESRKVAEEAKKSTAASATAAATASAKSASAAKDASATTATAAKSAATSVVTSATQAADAVVAAKKREAEAAKKSAADSMAAAKAAAAESLKAANVAVDAAEKAADKADTAVKRLNDNVRDRMKSTGTAMSLAVTLPLVLMGKRAMDLAGDFETSMNVLQNASKATKGELTALGNEARKLGADTKLPATSAVDAAKAMTELAKGGLSVRDAMSAARGTLQLAAAANIEATQAAKIQVAALGAFNLKGTEAARVANLLAASANAAQGEMTDTAAAMQQAAAIYAGAGQSIEDLTVGITQMARAGVLGSDAGTSLKTMLMSLQGPSDKAAETLGRLGIQVYDTQGKMLPMRELVGQFSTALGKLTQEERDRANVTIFGTDASRAALRVLEAGLPTYDATLKAIKDRTAAEDAATARTKGYKGAIEGFNSSLDTTLQMFAEPALSAGAGFFRSLSDGLGALNSASPALKNTAVVLGLAAAATGPLILGVGAVAGGIRNVIELRGMFRTAMEAKRTALTAATTASNLATVAETRHAAANTAAATTSGAATVAAGAQSTANTATATTATTAAVAETRLATASTAAGGAAATATTAAIGQATANTAVGTTANVAAGQVGIFRGALMALRAQAVLTAGSLTAMAAAAWAGWEAGSAMSRWMDEQAQKRGFENTGSELYDTFGAATNGKKAAGTGMNAAQFKSAWERQHGRPMTPKDKAWGSYQKRAGSEAALADPRTAAEDARLSAAGRAYAATPAYQQAQFEKKRREREAAQAKAQNAARRARIEEQKRNIKLSARDQAEREQAERELGQRNRAAAYNAANPAKTKGAKKSTATKAEAAVLTGALVAQMALATNSPLVKNSCADFTSRVVSQYTKGLYDQGGKIQQSAAGMERDLLKRGGKYVSAKQAKAGDVVVGPGKGPSGRHVGVYVGGGKWVDSSGGVDYGERDPRTGKVRGARAFDAAKGQKIISLPSQYRDRKFKGLSAGDDPAVRQLTAVEELQKKVAEGADRMRQAIAAQNDPRARYAELLGVSLREYKTLAPAQQAEVERLAAIGEKSDKAAKFAQAHAEAMANLRREHVMATGSERDKRAYNRFGKTYDQLSDPANKAALDAEMAREKWNKTEAEAQKARGVSRAKAMMAPVLKRFTGGAVDGSGGEFSRRKAELEEEVRLVGVVTEAERTKIELEGEAYRKWSPAQKETLIALVAEREAREKLAEATRTATEREKERQQAVWDNMVRHQREVAEKAAAEQEARELATRRQAEDTAGIITSAFRRSGTAVGNVFNDIARDWSGMMADMLASWAQSELANGLEGLMVGKSRNSPASQAATQQAPASGWLGALGGLIGLSTDAVRAARKPTFTPGYNPNGGGGFFGMAGSLMGGMGGGYSVKLPGFATGGVPEVGRTFVAGERGPEVITLGKTARVYSNDDSAQLFGGGANITVVQNINAMDTADFKRHRGKMASGAFKSISREARRNNVK